MNELKNPSDYMMNSSCLWNKEWSITKVPKCKLQYCLNIPKPPLFHGFEFVPFEKQEHLELDQDTNVYNPTLPYNMNADAEFLTGRELLFEGLLSRTVPLVTANQVEPFSVTLYDQFDSPALMVYLDSIHSHHVATSTVIIHYFTYITLILVTNYI